MTMRLKLSDGTTTIDLFGGSDSLARHGGVAMPSPMVNARFVRSAIVDGADLASSVYNERQIRIMLKIQGTSLSDIRDNVRSVQRVLEDAKQRVLSGFGTQFYLEVQWGDTANESVLFDILRGDLSLPPNFWGVSLKTHFTIVDARLTLTTKPFGRWANIDITQETHDNSQGARLIKESYITGDDGAAAISLSTWRGMTFTTSSAFTAKGAAIYGSANSIGGDPGVLTLELFATSAGLPTGAAIATGTLDSDGVPGGATRFGWVRIDFDTPAALSNATLYAVVAHTVGPADFSWRRDTGGGFGGGNAVQSVDTGSSWTSAAPIDHLFAVYAADTKVNYQDITATAGQGDVPARMYMKINPANATGSKKVWVAKRSGSRQTDDVWLDAVDFSTTTNIVGGAHILEEIGNERIDGDPSGDFYATVSIVPTGGAIAADTDIARVNYSIASGSWPRGQFRVLCRAKVDGDDNNDFDHFSFGYGWSYGTKTSAPTEAANRYFEPAAENTWEVLDLGELLLPPTPESDIAGNATFELRLYVHAKDTLTQNEAYHFHIDWIMFLPIDEGIVIVDSVAAADVLALDGISDPSNVFKIDGSDNIDDFPDRQGAPPTLGRESTRLYIVRDDDDTVTHAVDTKYQPQFLNV